jgi:hypothetical protein
MPTEAGFMALNLDTYQVCSKFTYDNHHNGGESTEGLSLISFKVTGYYMVCFYSAVFIQGRKLLACSHPDEDKGY